MSKNSIIVNSPYFDLSVQLNGDHAEMVMSLKTPFQTTRAVPHTYEMLSEYLPGVFCTQCFNKDNLPFEEKVKDTNLAHLFEHVLLEYLIEERGEDGGKKISYRGITKWDWRKGKDPVGTYRIAVTISQEETMLLHNALRKAVELIERLLNGIQLPTPAPVSAPAYTR